MSSEIQRTEKEVARKIVPTSTPTRVAKISLGVPTDSKGITIVDLAAGCCPLVAELISGGVNAYALDRIYGEKKSWIKAEAQKSLRGLITKTPREQRQMLLEHGQLAFDLFWQSFNKHPNRYRAGYLTHLPFADNFADFVGSLSGLSYFVMFDFAVYKAAVLEAVRITKPGGNIVIAPFGDATKPLFIYREQRLLQELEEEGIGKIQVERDIPSFIRSRLRIERSGLFL